MKKVVIGVVCLLLGIIIGLGAVAGTIFAILSLKVDTVLGWVGLDDDNRNEDGSYKYIYGDQSILNTISDTIDILSDLDTNTLGGLNVLFPAIELAIDSVNDTLESSLGVTLDKDGLLDEPISNLGSYLSDYVMDLEVYPIVETVIPSYVTGDDIVAIFVRALVLGVEADVYIDDSGVYHPVYYVEVTYENGDGDYDADYIYFYLDESFETGGDGAEYVVYTAVYLEKNEDGEYVLTGETEEDYDASSAVCTGDYYTVPGDGEEDGVEYVLVNPIRLRDFSESENITSGIYAIPISDIMGGEDNVILDVLGDYTIGDLVEGDIDFNSIPIAAFVDMTPGTDDTLISLLYGVNGIQDARLLEDNDFDGYICIYTDDDGVAHDAYIETDDNGHISRIYYEEETEDGDVRQIEIEGVTLGNVSGLVDNLELVTVMGYPDVDDALMMYILYGVSDVVYSGIDSETGYETYTGTYIDSDDVTHECTIYVREIDGALKATASSYETDDDGKTVSSATTLNDISSVVGNVTNALSIPDFLNEVNVDDAIFMYLCYSVYDIYQDSEGSWHGYLTVDGVERFVDIHTTTVVADDGSETQIVDQIVWEETETIDGVDVTTVHRVTGTKIGDIDGILSGITSDLTLPVFIGDVKTSDALMAYLTYSLTGITETVDEYGNGTGVWTAIYHYTDGDESLSISVALVTEVRDDGSTYITGIAGEVDGDRIRGTTIDDIQGQIDGLMDDVPIRDILGESDDDNVFLDALGDATINSLGDAINNISLQSLFPEEVYESTVTLFVRYTYVDGSTGDSFEYVYGKGDTAETDYSGYTFYYKVSVTDENANTTYTFNKLTYTVDGQETTISNQATLQTAIQALNTGKDDKITDFYIYTAVMRQAVSRECSLYTSDEYYVTSEESGDTGYEKDQSGNYVVNDYIAFSTDYIYYTYDESTGKYEIYGTDGKVGSYEEFISITTGTNGSDPVALYTYGAPSSVWKLMVCKRVVGEDGTYSYDETLSNINDLSNLISNTAQNLSDATLYEFLELGILDTTYEILNTPISEYTSVEGQTLGDLTLDEMVNLLGTLLSAMSQGGAEP